MREAQLHWSIDNSQPVTPLPLKSFQKIGLKNSDELTRRLHAGQHRHLRFLRSQLPSFEDAEDALQDATLKLIQHDDASATIEMPEALIGVSLRHTVIDRYRRAAAKRRLTEALMAQPRESTEPNEPNDDDETLSAAACLKETLTKLKPEYGTLLRQVYLEEISIKEVAKSEQLTSNNAAVRIHRARSALRQAMRHQCKTCAVEDCWARHRLAALSAPTVAINPEAAPDIACKYSIQPFEKRNHYAN